MNFHALGIDIAHFEIEGFPQPQTHAEAIKNKSLITQLTRTVEQAFNLFQGQEIGQGFDLRGPHNVDPVPLLLQYIFVKELQAVAVDFYRRLGVGLHQGLEVGFKLLLGQNVGWAVEKLGDTPYGTRINLDRRVGFALAFRRFSR